MWIPGRKILSRYGFVNTYHFRMYKKIVLTKQLQRACGWCLSSGGSSSGGENMVFIACLVVIAVAHPHNLLHYCLPETADFFLSLSILNIEKKNPPDFAFLFYYHDSKIPCLGLHWRELSVFHLVNCEISNWWALCWTETPFGQSHTQKTSYFSKVKKNYE